MVPDLFFIIHWWFFLFVLGVLFLPLTFFIFQKFIDKGYIFSKILAIIFLSYLLFILGITHVAQFTKITITIVLIIFALMNFLGARFFSLNYISIIKRFWKLFIFEEVLFFIILTLWSYVRGYTSEIHGLEKYMDFGFVNSILRADYFPPRDMWFTPLSINYYYFGHLMTAVLTKLSGIESFITYNLMIATLCAFTFVCSFSLGLNLFYIFMTTSQKNKNDVQKNNFKFSHFFSFPLLAGLLSGLLVSFSGNLHTLYTLFKPYQNENPVPLWQLAFSPSSFPNSYWYPNATRFIHNTIHEFPLYSFVVSDLHGHVLSIPIVLTIIALLFHTFLIKKLTILLSIFISFLLAAAYMTNAWDGIIYFLLTTLVIFYFEYQRVTKDKTLSTTNNPILQILPINHLTKKLNNIVLNNWFIDLFIGLFVYLFIIGVAFIIFTFPFSLYFKPFVSGIGILCAPSFLTKIGHLGPFLFEKDHCQLSLWWQLLTLYGFFYFFVISFLVFLFRKKNKTIITKPDVFILILIILSTLLILIPELIYAKDIYPAHYRANTMFKLVYQAFMMLSISSVYIFFRIYKPHKNKIWSFFSFLLFIFVMIYPYFAINSYYGNLQIYQGLDGLKYLKNSYPTDYDAINWINKNIKGQPILLEAQGDSYTDYARISANTGLPTVLGWTVHEWLWRGTYDIPAPRIDDITKLYESTNMKLTKSLVKKYTIQLVFVGDLERQKYSNLNETKFDKMGKIIYKKGQTKIYLLD